MRFFSFGCSFTNYHWPTWADIRSLDFDEFQNWGAQSAGNQHILYSLIECIQRNNINDSDTVEIMWSAINRETGFKDDDWVHNRGALEKSVSFINNDWFNDRKQTSDTKGYTLITISLIEAVRKILDGIGCRYKFYSMSPIVSNEPEMSDINTLYRETIELVSPSVFEIVYKEDWNSRPDINVVRSKATEAQYKKQHLAEVYHECAGPDWPDFDDFFNNNCTIDINIKQELTDLKFLEWRDNIKRSDTSKKLITDTHPTPLGHLEYLQHFVEISNEQKEYAMYWDDIVKSQNVFSFNPQSKRTVRLGKSR